MSVKVISFYSFKGGAGRTVCVANVARHLARELNATATNPLLVMDLDLDSAGLTIMLRQYGFENSPYSTAKLLSGKLSLNVTDTEERFFAEGIVDISQQVGSPDKTVRFVGTEVTGRDAGDVRGEGETNMLYFVRDTCEAHGYRAVLVDAASGRQDTARICHRISDVIVYCCRITDQFLYGTRKQIEYFLQNLRASDSPPVIILLPVALPAVTDDWKKERMKSALFSLERIQADFREHAPCVLLEGVPEIESFKWEESILTDSSGDEPGSASFQQVATKIHELLVGTAATKRT